jgi:predicted permease
VLFVSPEALVKDLVLALRALRKHPGLTAVVALSIGLGVGANAMVYTWLDQLILHPFPAVPDADRLVVLSPVGPDGEVRGMPPVSYLGYRDWRARSEIFENDVAAHVFVRLNGRIPGENASEPVWGEMVSGNFFAATEAAPVLGRALTDGDEDSRAAVAVVSERFWRRRLGGDPAILGRHLLLNGVDVSVVGVAPREFGGIVVGVAFDVWVPITLQPQMLPGEDRLSDRGARWIQAFGRLRPGVTLDSGGESFDATARLSSAEAGESPIQGGAMRRIRETQLGSLLFPMVTAMLGVTGLVLLTACANVANLLLARGTAQRKENGIRIALGASRSRVAAHSLAHSGALALLGGAVGVLIARWAGDVFQLFIPVVPLPVSVSLGLNLRVVVAAFLVTFLAALVIGCVPSLRAARFELAPVLKDDGRGRTGGRSRLRSALVIAQVAFSMIALVLGGLFLRSLGAAESMDVGYEEPSQLLLVGTELGAAGIDASEAPAVVDRVLERARELPGVRAAAFSTMVPLGFGGHVLAKTLVDGYTPRADESLDVERVLVSASYFETMGIPILRGRPTDEGDRAGSLRVAVVNEAFASRYWPGLDPIGRRLNQGPGWATVVGVAKDSVYRDLGESPHPVVWSSVKQWPATGLTLLVRSDGAPQALVEPLRRSFFAVHADLPFFEPRTLAEHMAAASFVQFVSASMLSAFGALSLVLAAVGIFGVLSYSVSLSRRDIAIATAIGATPRRVVSDVLGNGMRRVATGILIGGVAAFFAGRLLSSALLEVGPGDPLTYLVTTLVIAVVAVAASLFPAWQASCVDPVTALK